MRKRIDWAIITLALLWFSSALLQAWPDEEVVDITGKYQFLNADDTLAILEEEEKLKGYVDVFQDEDESDDILSYPITAGTRKKNQVEFTTGKIHQKYYRFSGRVERGSGRTEKDADFLRLVGNVEIVTVNGESGEETAQRIHVVLKMLGYEKEPE